MPPRFMWAVTRLGLRLIAFSVAQGRCQDRRLAILGIHSFRDTCCSRVRYVLLCLIIGWRFLGLAFPASLNSFEEYLNYFGLCLLTF